MDLPGSPTLTVNTRFSGISFDGPLSECGGGLASLPSSPLLPTSPVGANFLGGMPRSTSGQSIPIFFQPDDLNSSRGSRVENPFEVEENGGEDDDDGTASLLGFYTSSSSGTSRRLSVSSSSGASSSTAPTEPPSPLTPTTHDKAFSTSPSAFPPSILHPAPVLSPAHHAYPPPPPLLNHRRKVSSRPGTAGSRPGTAGSCTCGSVPNSPPRAGSAGGIRSSRSTSSLKHGLRSSQSAHVPPADAFFDHNSPYRPSTASTVASYQPIPIRLVPPTPTPATREVRAAASPFRRAAPTTPPSSPRPSPPSPPRTGTACSTPNETSKPLPSLPIFPTVARPSTATSRAGRRNRTPPESEQEGVYNVPLFPPCVYPPSAPSSTFSSPAQRTLRTAKSSPFLGASPKSSRKGYSRIPPRTASGLAPDVAQSATSSSSSTLSSAASFDSLATTFFLPIPGETTISVLIDQEGFREALVEFEYTGTDEQSGLLEFVAKMPAIGRERDGWPFHVGFLQTPPYLRRLAITADPSRDYLPREACLPITEKDGVYKVSSARSAPTSSSSNSNTGAQPYYCLAYEVKERLNLVGQRMKGERLLKPLVFICSRDFLSPIGLIELMAKTFTLPATATLVKHTPKRPATRG
ncbi:hypothetical protein JCM10213_001906 [Rhodosporidiobolus nylandii]